MAATQPSHVLRMLLIQKKQYIKSFVSLKQVNERLR